MGQPTAHITTDLPTTLFLKFFHISIQWLYKDYAMTTSSTTVCANANSLLCQQSLALYLADRNCPEPSTRTPAMDTWWLVI